MSKKAYISVATFLLGVYATTWTLVFLLQDAAARGSAAAVYAFFFGTVWAPTLLALGIVRFVEHQHVGAFLRTHLRWPRPIAWFAVAALVPALATATAIAVARARGLHAPFVALGALPFIIGMRIATGATGEELGWRAFLMERLTPSLGVVSAALLTAVLWSSWHIAGIAFRGSGLDVVPVAPFLISAVSIGFFLALVFSRTRNVLASMLAHLSLNVSLSIGGTSPRAPAFWWVITGVTAAASALVVWRWSRDGRPLRAEGADPERSAAPA